MQSLDLFNQHEQPERDYLTIYLWGNNGDFAEYTIPSSIKKQGTRVIREYIRENNIFKRKAGATPFGAWFSQAEAAV